MFRCTTAKYDTLYERWLDRPGDLLDLGGYRPPDRLLDFCGGTGAVTHEALRRGASPSTVTLFDLAPRLGMAEVRSVQGDARLAKLLLHLHGPFDIIVCRQALGYLNLGPVENSLFDHLADLLPIGGRLVFNSFVRPRWSWKVYRRGGRSFIEASGFVGHTVLHLQASPLVGADLSVFRWHSEADVRRRLSRFKVDIFKSGSSVRWRCVRTR